MEASVILGSVERICEDSHTSTDRNKLTVRYRVVCRPRFLRRVAEEQPENRKKHFIKRSVSCEEIEMCRGNRARSPVMRAVSTYCSEVIETCKLIIHPCEAKELRRISPKRRARSRSSASRERSCSNEKRRSSSSQKKTPDLKYGSKKSSNTEKHSQERKTSIQKVISFPTNSLLHSAVVQGDIELAQRLLLRDPCAINKLSVEGTAPIHEAAINGDMECLQLLIKHGACLEARDKHKRSALEYAVLVGNFDCASLLLSYGADDQKVRDGVPIQ